MTSPALRFRPRVREVPSWLDWVCSTGFISVRRGTVNLCFRIEALIPASLRDNHISMTHKYIVAQSKVSKNTTRLWLQASTHSFNRCRNSSDLFGFGRYGSGRSVVKVYKASSCSFFQSCVLYAFTFCTFLPALARTSREASCDATSIELASVAVLPNNVIFLSANAETRNSGSLNGCFSVPSLGIMNF